MKSQPGSESGTMSCGTMIILIPFGIGFIVYLFGIIWLLDSINIELHSRWVMLLVAPYFYAVYYLMTYFKNRRNNFTSSDSGMENLESASPDFQNNTTKSQLTPVEWALIIALGIFVIIIVGFLVFA